MDRQVCRDGKPEHRPIEKKVRPVQPPVHQDEHRRQCDAYTDMYYGERNQIRHGSCGPADITLCSCVPVFAGLRFLSESGWPDGRRKTRFLFCHPQTSKVYTIPVKLESGIVLYCPWRRGPSQQARVRDILWTLVLSIHLDTALNLMWAAISVAALVWFTRLEWNRRRRVSAARTPSATVCRLPDGRCHLPQHQRQRRSFPLLPTADPDAAKRRLRKRAAGRPAGEGQPATCPVAGDPGAFPGQRIPAVHLWAVLCRSFSLAPSFLVHPVHRLQRRASPPFGIALLSRF